jgi:uncharacterized membrane protein YoaK (UPF0700 family)
VLLCLLATVTGTFDAISYLGLHRVFVANMTGNTVLVGLHAGQGDWLNALRVALALVGFAAGIATGGLLILRERLRLTTALAAEAIMLVIVAVIWVAAGTAPQRAALYALVLLSSSAMGLQSAAIHSLKVPDVLTTAITNTFAAFTLGLLPRLVPNNEQHHPILLQAAVCATYVVGAGIGGAARAAWGTHAIVISFLVLVLAIAWCLFHGLGRPPRVSGIIS